VAKDYCGQRAGCFLGGGPVWLRELAAHGAPVALAPLTSADYSRDIAPLLQTKCVACHSPATSRRLR